MFLPTADMAPVLKLHLMCIITFWDERCSTSLSLVEIGMSTCEADSMVLVLVIECGQEKGGKKTTTIVRKSDTNY